MYSGLSIRILGSFHAEVYVSVKSYIKGETRQYLDKREEWILRAYWICLLTKQKSSIKKTELFKVPNRPLHIYHRTILLFSVELLFD